MSAQAPAQIDLIYRRCGEYHIFASKGIRGLVHVAHTEMHAAYENVMKALARHVKATYGIDAHYRPEQDFASFARSVDSGTNLARLFVFKLDVEATACH